MTQPQPLRILLVEDDGGIAHVIRLGLSDLGFPFDLDHAVTAEEGVDFWQHHVYDLVLTDYNLRGKNGLDMISQLKLQDSTVPMVLVTAYDTPALRKQARNAGVERFVAKPFFIDEFTAMVRLLLPTRVSQLGV